MGLVQIMTLVGGFAMGTAASSQPQLVLYPAPERETPSEAYRVAVNGQEVFVYRARVREEIDKRQDALWSHKHGGATDWASFAYFDFAGKVAVTIRPGRPFQKARVVPASFGIEATVKDGAVRFDLDQPRPVTILLDDTFEHPLHLFANPPETDRPDPKDPDVLYFGPGVHEIGTTRVRSGQTVYIAGGAVVRGKILPEEKGQYSEKWKVWFYEPLLTVEKAKHVRICGRGILDGGLIPHPGKSTISVSDSSDVRIEGIIIRNSANWAVSLQGSESVRVTGIKQISGRLNSDGINPVSCRNIRIADCFIRNRDDSIAVKATMPGRPSEDIVAERCVIWNDWGFALGVTYETRAPIRNVRFRDCDVLHAEMWALGIYVVDSGTVSDVRFQNIRVEHAKDKLVRLQIHKDVWANDTEFGHIRGIRFRDISFTGQVAPRSSIQGKNDEHRVEDVTFENLRIQGKPITGAELGRFDINSFSGHIRFAAR